MPLRANIASILVIGSGPIQIGQGCEFDYSGTQACRALRKVGLRVILVNSNPATIMTDPDSADQIYIEPLQLNALEKIIVAEKPDALLPTMGGQVALNLFLELEAAGILAKHHVQALGVTSRTVELAEDRSRFKDLVAKLGLGVVRGGMFHDLKGAVLLGETLRFPLILRASFTLGGGGGGVAKNQEELLFLAQKALNASARGEVSVEESISGWKEIEFEVMRDAAGNFVVVCGVENLNPMGVHTGDSITVAPCMTLTDREYQALRCMARTVFEAVGMESGGANIQFALHPETGEVVIVEMNPRVSRSSALVSKATGYPVAALSALLAVGYTLSELQNEITGGTPAAFEPALDYVAVKIPRWDFDKFSGGSATLGIQMKSVGEVLAFGRSFADAFQRAWRSLECGFPGFMSLPEGADWQSALSETTPSLCMAIKSALEHGMSIAALHACTKISPWFLAQMHSLVEIEHSLRKKTLDATQLRNASQAGFTRTQIAVLSQKTYAEVEALRIENHICPTFKMVDTCAGEFEARTPYYFKTWEQENDNRVSQARKVVILGSGPNRIGQGIEFDYACVHAVQAARALGFEAIMLNCNPETVSTDYQVSDKLYVEPLTEEDVLDVLRAESPDGVLVQFGGQTPLKLAQAIEAAGFRIFGSDFATVELCEDRKRFCEILHALGVRVPAWGTALSVAEAHVIAQRIGFPLLIRPSFVLGGQGMRIVRGSSELDLAMRAATGISPGLPVLLDRYLEDAEEFDVDVITDGTTAHVPAILHHVEEAGVHSGDSCCVTPPQGVDLELLEKMSSLACRLAGQLRVVGVMNVQFAVQKSEIFVLEVNPRASRTLPFVAKATGMPIARYAAELCLGKKLASLSLPWLPIQSPFVSVKVPVFPYAKFPHFPPYPGPEMRSLGEVMGRANTLPEALRKGYLGAGYRLTQKGIAVVICTGEGRLSQSACGKRDAALMRLRTAGIKVLSLSGPETLQALLKDEVNLLIDLVDPGSSGTPSHASAAAAACARGIPIATVPGALEALSLAFAASRDCEVSPLC